MQAKPKRLDKLLTDLLVDASIFLAFLVALDPRLSGIAIHEWLSAALTAAILLHLLLHWSWIAAVTRRFFSKVTGQARTNYMLNALLFIDFTLIMFTGIMISEEILPWLGIRLERNMLWSRLHSLTADWSLILIGLHVALHWRWVLATLKRYLVKPFQRVRKPALGEEAQS